MSLQVLIMAAGKGTRMRSAKPKVLHTLAGRPLLDHVLDTAGALAPQHMVVVTGHGAADVDAHVGARARCVLQQPQLGTGHAVREASSALADDSGTTLILNGDVPLIEAATARALAEACGGSRLALLTVTLADATGYGRILRREDGGIIGIVEHKDASEAQRGIREVYTGMMAAPTAALKRWVAALKDDNAQREYYLTDIVAMAVAEGVPVVGAAAGSETEVLGVNSPAQLAELERRLQARVASKLMEGGVRLADPARLDVRGELVCGSDVEIDVGCVFEGRVTLGEGVRIGPYCVLKNAAIASGTQVAAYTHMEGARVGADARIGPYARLRPGAELGDQVHIGNFVEIKNSQLARGAKANHLAYLGDTTMGARSNFGAGSITANYDGANKHRTVIGEDVLIGSNCVLVAPITVGDGATVGGGSTLTRPAPEGQLTLTRAPQTSYAHWKRPQKKKG